MFDESSRRLLRSAPDLPGLNAETLDELLTAAHIELATIRSSPSDQDAERSSELLARVRRLALTFEAYVALDLRPDQTRAAAFVALRVPLRMRAHGDRAPATALRFHKPRAQPWPQATGQQWNGEVMARSG